jgi:hypothetical protein
VHVRVGLTAHAGPCAFQQAFPQRGSRRKLGLLLHECDTQSVASLKLPIVKMSEARDDPQQRGLACTVAADESKPFPGPQRELRAIEEGPVAEGEVSVEKCDE